MKLLHWSVFILLSIVSVYIGFLHYSPPESGLKFSVFGYWNILALVVLFSATIWKTYSNSLKQWAFNRGNWIVVGVAIVASLFLYTREGGGFKITFDEHTIANTAKSLHYDRTAVYRESSLMLLDETSAVDKRPILFPFLIATAHDIFGYDIDNSFRLNGILTVVFLILLYTLGRTLFDARAGWLAMALAVSTPIISQNSSGGGLEVTNLVGIFTTFLLALRYAEKPECLNRFSCLIVSVALFSHARYESPILVAPAIAVIAINWFRMRSIQISWIAAVAPLFFIPVAWQHKYADARIDFKQIQNEGDTFFGLSYLSDNLGHATNFFFTHNRMVASTPLVGVIGILCLIALLALSLTRNKEWSQRLKTLYVAQIFGLTLIAQFLLILGFSHGQLDNPIVTRLGLPFISLTILCGGIGLSIVSQATSTHRIAVFATAAICFLYAVHRYSNPLYTTNNMILKRIEWLVDRHEALPNGNYLYISTVSQEFQLRDIANISVKRAVQKAANLEMHLNLKTFDEIFVVQFFGVRIGDDETERFLLSGNDVGPWFELETIDEISMLPMNFTRLSRVASIHSRTDDREGDAALRESLSQEEVSRVYDIGPEAYQIWLKTLP